MQHTIAECGYSCISALLAHFKSPLPVHIVKQLVGSTERGLNIAQLKKAFEKVGASCEVIAFDSGLADAYPCPGVVLTSHGHYIALIKRSGDEFRIFDPATGWQSKSVAELDVDPRAMGILVSGVKLSPKLAGRMPRIQTKEILEVLLAPRALQVLALAAISQIFMLAIPLFTKWSVDAALPGVSLSGFSTLAIAYVLVSIIGQLSTVFVALGNQAVASELHLRMEVGLFQRLAQRNIDWFQARPLGYAFMQSQTLAAIRYFYSELAGRVLSILLMALVGTVAIFYVSPWLVLPGLLGVATTTTINLLFQNQQQTVSAQTLHVQSRYRNFFLDVVSQLPMLRRIGGLDQARVQLFAHIRAVTSVQLKSTRVNAAKGALSATVTNFERLTFLCLAGYFVSAENYSLGAFVAVGLYKDQLASAIGVLFQLWQQHALLLPHRDQLAEVYDAELAQALSSQAFRIGAGVVCLDKVYFRYGSLDDYVLRDISFHISSGEFVILRGTSGSGKSTLLKLISGATNPSEGQILIDGEHSQPTYCGLGSVLQSDRLIQGSIRENILLFRDGSDTDLRKALELAGLTEFVKSLPMGLNTGIGEGMTGISSGQRQRILLARALFCDPKLLILDEATSNLDVKSESEILERISRLGITTILCSHRPEAWRNADRVFEIRGGNLFEIDNDSYKVSNGQSNM